MNDAMRRATTSAIGVLLLYATAIPVHATTITVTNTNDSSPGSSTFTRDYSCIASTSRTDIRSDGNQNAYVARGLYPDPNSDTLHRPIRDNSDRGQLRARGNRHRQSRG